MLRVLDCGHTSDKYGLKADHTEHCYACLHAADVATLADPDTRAYTGYLSSDGRAITNWPGGTLMIVTRWNDARTGFRDVTGRKAVIRSVWAKTPDGRTWYGKGSGCGMIITLRVTKGGR